MTQDTQSVLKTILMFPLIVTMVIMVITVQTVLQHPFVLAGLKNMKQRCNFIVIAYKYHHILGKPVPEELYSIFIYLK